MTRAILLATAAAALLSPACAADLAVKAAPNVFTAASVSPCQTATASTPLSCSGFYVGGGLAGEGSNADIIGSGINGSVFAGGITPTADVGYQYINGNWMLGAEFDAGYSVGTGATVNGVGGGFNGFRITEDFQGGGNLFGLFGTQAPITVPASLANSVLATYAHVGTTQWSLPGGWANGLVSGAGIKGDVSPRIFWDIRYSHVNFNAARTSGLTIKDDDSVMALVNFKF